MKNDYSIDDILNAVDELQNIKKGKKIFYKQKKIEIEKNQIPKKSMLKLILDLKRIS